MDDLLDKKITIRDALNSGYLSSKILSDFDIWTRVQMIKETENLPKTTALEECAERCRIARSTAFQSYSMYEKLSPKLIGLE